LGVSEAGQRQSLGLSVCFSNLAPVQRSQLNEAHAELKLALAIDEYQQSHMSKVDLRRLLGFETRPALDGFLKEHGVFEEYTLNNLEHNRQDLRRAGF
jgi:hypothetical protein